MSREPSPERGRIPVSMRARGWSFVGLVGVSASLFVACGGGKAAVGAAGARSTTTVDREDVVVTAASFPNITTMTRVGDHYVGNLLGRLDATLAVARAGKGRYPVGTIVQLVPQEAMVKRRAGFDPATDDWEFFFLKVSAQGTTIVTRGTTNVVNVFGGNCVSCHGAAAPQFDFVCGKDHGCAPLPLTDELIMRVQQADPRPRTG